MKFHRAGPAVRIPYIYEPLPPGKTTRLINLKPAWNRAARLDFTLEAVNIQSTPTDLHIPYTAISYTWEGQTPTRAVICDGKELLITANAEDALRRLRPRRDNETKRYFWIDAICINQSSVEDKNRQVTHMASIYESAEKIAVWLGHVKGPELLYWPAVAKLLRDEKVAERMKAARNDNAFVPGLSLLTTKRYWTRIWTIQEIAGYLSKTKL